MFCAYISTYVAQCPISFGGHILDMMVPFQVMAQGILHGLLPLKLDHVEYTGFGWGSGPWRYA